MNAASVPMTERFQLFPEAANTLTKLDWLQSMTINDLTKTCIEHHDMQMPKFTKYLRTWGEAVTVKSGKDGKLCDRGITTMVVGHVDHHEEDVYRMLNLETGQITETQDIIWIFRMYYKCENSKTIHKLPIVSLRVPRTVGSDD